MATQVKGLDRLLRQIAALPKLQVAAAREAIVQGAEELAGAIARAAPKSSGEMAQGVKAAPADTAKGEAGIAMKVTAPPPAMWVEFGTKSQPKGRYKDAKGKSRISKRAHHATRAEPFFWPTVRAYKKRIKSRIVRNANKAAKAAAQIS